MYAIRSYYVDFSPYAEKLVQDLNSYNSDTKNIALQILSKIPEGVEHHEFYQRVRITSYNVCYTKLLRSKKHLT